MYPRTQTCVVKHASALQVLGASAVAAGVALAAFPAADGASVFTEVGTYPGLPCLPSVKGPALPHAMHMLAMKAAQDQRHSCHATCMSKHGTASHIVNWQHATVAS